MGFYSRFILPRFYDLTMDRPFWKKHRAAQLADVRGEVLEIGVGTGLNLPHYPEHVRKITTVDPSQGMNRVLRRRVAQTGVEVDGHVVSSEKLPFPEATFDSVVSTITLCSIDNVSSALAEVYRVLKPGGRYHFLEHGLSDDPRVQRWQRRLNWIQSKVADGCRLDLDVRGVLGELPFQAMEIDNFYMERTPRAQGYMYRGVATK